MKQQDTFLYLSLLLERKWTEKKIITFLPNCIWLEKEWGKENDPSVCIPSSLEIKNSKGDIFQVYCKESQYFSTCPPLTHTYTHEHCIYNDPCFEDLNVNQIMILCCQWKACWSCQMKIWIERISGKGLEQMICSWVMWLGFRMQLERRKK